MVSSDVTKAQCGLHRRITGAVAVLVVLVLLPVVGGCDLQRLTVEQTAGVLRAGAVATEREPDVQFAREAIPGNLKTIETFLVSAPDNEILLELLARGYYSYAFGFLEQELEVAQYEFASEEEIRNLRSRTTIHYLRARDYAWELLDRPPVREAAEAGDLEALKARLAELDVEDVPGLFWVGYGWGSAINHLQDDPDEVAALPVVEAIMDRVEELDEGYYWGGVHFFKGVYWASRPEMFGGDPTLAKKHFDIAMAGHGEANLMIPYLYARFYAPQVQDRKMFVELMKRVATADVDAYPDLRLNNEIAKERARWWLAHIDELIYQ